MVVEHCLSGETEPYTVLWEGGWGFEGTFCWDGTVDDQDLLDYMQDQDNCGDVVALDAYSKDILYWQFVPDLDLKCSLEIDIGWCDNGSANDAPVSSPPPSVGACPSCQ